VLYLHLHHFRTHICTQRFELFLDSHVLDIKILLVRLNYLLQICDRALTNLRQFIESADSFLTVDQALIDVFTALLVHSATVNNQV
jgi:hypothetical protein